MADDKTHTTEQKSAQTQKLAENYKPLCVFGIMTNEAGLRIASEMRAWLQHRYELHEVLHDGSQFELPALREAQRLSIERNEPVLYIHTRGAVNTYPTTVPTRRMWAEEFGVQWRKYFTLANTAAPMVVCPFVDYDKETRYNGFVANPAAWAKLDLQPTTDRMDYERLWCKHPDVPVIGVLITRSDWAIKDIRQYLYRNYGN